MSILLTVLFSVAAALGAVGRVTVDTLVRRGRPGTAGIVVVNIAGSLLLGVLTALAGVLWYDAGWHISTAYPPAWYVIAGVGGCGSFTTFSTAITDVLALVRARHWGRAVGLLVGTWVGSVAAVGAGIWLAS